MESESDDFPIGFMDPENIEMAMRKLGLLELYEQKELKCDTCDHIVTKDNLRIIYKKNGKLYIGCDDEACYHEIIRMIKS